jgi:hypothetical protein
MHPDWRFWIGALFMFEALAIAATKCREMKAPLQPSV